MLLSDYSIFKDWRADAAAIGKIELEHK